MKSFLFFLLFLFSTLCSNAQVGIGTTSPSGALDISSSSEGLLIPRIALTGTSTVLPVLTATTSELVYNTATASDVTPGFYYLSTPLGPWVRIGGASGAWLTTGNTGIVNGTNFIGTAAATNVDVAFRRNNLAAGKIGTTSTSFGLGSANTNTAAGTTAFGVNALSLNVGALGNTAIGYNALQTSTGANNTAVGNDALAANTSGIQNTAVGKDALGQKTTGSANTALGWEASGGAGTFSNVTAVGFQALAANNQGNVTGLGFQAGRLNTGGNLTAVGFQAAYNNTAQNNTAIGNFAMDGISSAASDRNVAVGVNALGRTTGATVSHNVAVGYDALSQCTSSGNVGVGYQTMLQITSGSNNVAIGDGAMTQGNSSSNTAVGKEALFNTSGSNNVAIGYFAGRSNGAGNNSTIIGYQAGASGFTNTTAIGYQASASASNQIQLGNSSISSARVQVAWTITSDRRLKSNIKESGLGLDFIKNLRPVSYFRNNDEAKKTEYGFVAQEIEEVLRTTGNTGDGILTKDGDGMYSVRYNDFIPITIKAIQEQQLIIEELQKTNAALIELNAEIIDRLETLEKKTIH